MVGNTVESRRRTLVAGYMIDIFNGIFGRVFDVVFFPFRGMTPWAGITIVSLLTAVLMLFVYRVFSDQEKIRTVKDRIIAHLLEIRLYRESLPVTFNAQGKILQYNVQYLGLSLRPVLVMIVPLVLALFQMDLWFGHEPLKPGESAMVKVRLKDGRTPSRARVDLRIPPGIVLETPPLRIDLGGEVDWRIRALEPGSRDLTVEVDGHPLSKRVVVGAKPLSRISAVRVAGNWIERLENPGEPAITQASAVDSLEIGYPARRMDFLGWRLHWLVVYFALSVLFGLALKGLFRVEI